MISIDYSLDLDL